MYYHQTTILWYYHIIIIIIIILLLSRRAWHQNNHACIHRNNLSMIWYRSIVARSKAGVCVSGCLFQPKNLLWFVFIRFVCATQRTQIATTHPHLDACSALCCCLKRAQREINTKYTHRQTYIYTHAKQFWKWYGAWVFISFWMNIDVVYIYTRIIYHYY